MPFASPGFPDLELYPSLQLLAQKDQTCKKEQVVFGYEGGRRSAAQRSKGVLPNTP